MWLFAVDWPVVVDAASAVGTVTAALIAAAALRTTASVASATERQVEAQTTPQLVEVGRGGYFEAGQEERLSTRSTGDISLPRKGYTLLDADETGKAFCSVPIENVGFGVGRITGARLRAGKSELGERFDAGRYIYVRPAGTERITIEAGSHDEWKVMRRAKLGIGPVFVLIQYEDFAGERQYVLELDLRPHADETNSWVIHQARHVGPDS